MSGTMFVFMFIGVATVSALPFRIVGWIEGHR